MLKQLINLFIKKNGRSPNAIEMLQLKFKAAEQAGKGKVIEFPRDKITDWRKAGPTTGKKADVVSSGIGKKDEAAKISRDDKIIADFMANADRVYYRFVSDTLAKVQNASKDEQLKIAKDIIHRKGMYHNLDEQDAAKILKSIDQNIKPVEPKAYGGLAGMLGERTSYRVGKTAKKKKKEPSDKDLRNMLFEMRMMPNFGEPINFPYKSLEDIPPKVLAMLRKDPNFDLETFLTKVGWSDPDKTRIQTKLKGDDEAWGLYSPMSDMSFLNYQKFGKSEPIGDGVLSIKSPSDADKVQTILHEMRHAKMKEPWFMKSSAVPKWVRKYEEAGGPDYLDKDIKDDFKKFRETQKDVSGEELYVRFMDQHFGDVAEKGTIAGSDYKPYFDKILKDHWDPYAQRYKDIIEEEKRVKSKPYGLAGGGLAPMLGEPTYTDENHRVPLDNGGMTLDEVADDVKLDNFIKNLDFIELMRKIPEGTSLDTIDDIKRRLNYERGISVAEGGRVPFSKGKVVKGLAALMDEFFPGTTKLGKTSKSMAPKTQLKQAIAGFKEREKAAKLKEMIKNKYQGRIDDDLLNKILVDDNPQRIAEVLATIDEALLMQGKGMGPETIMTTLRDSWKRKKNASGGRVSLSSGGVAGMLGE